MPSHRILYVGQDLTLLKTLMEVLGDCFVVRCLGGSMEHVLIKSEIRYSLLLLDEELPETTGLELADFAREIKHRERTPIIILSANKARCADANIFFKQPDDYKLLVSAIEQLLAAPQ